MKLQDIPESSLRDICSAHCVQHLYLFGSMKSGKANPESDVDLLVRFELSGIDDYFENFFSLKSGLEKFFRHPVDLVEDQAIRNPVFRRILDREKELIYGRTDC